jgi:hypothetical protein
MKQGLMALIVGVFAVSALFLKSCGKNIFRASRPAANKIYRAKPYNYFPLPDGRDRWNQE